MKRAFQTGPARWGDGVNWRGTRLKFLAAVPIRNGLGESGGQDEPAWPRYIRTTDIAGPRTLRDDVFASLPPDVARGAMLRRGDIVMTAAGATIGKTLLYASDDPACYAGYLARFRPNTDVDGRFIAYWMESQPYWDQIEAGKVVSTIENLSASKYQNLRLSVPDLDHQRAIADYLDRETARIDALIEKKRQMVRALELRLGVLAHDLTTATGREVPLRRVILQIKTGTTPPADQMEQLRDGSLPWYSPGDVGDWLELQEPSRTLDREAVAQGWVPRFAANSTLIVGIGATAGSVAHLDCDGSGNQQMTCLVPGPRILPRFLSWQLFSRTEELRATAPFTTLPILNNDFLKAASLFIPTIEEQAAIVGRLDELAKEMQRVVQLLERQVELLLEHRQALITAAVTGELDVAGVAA